MAAEGRKIADAGKSQLYADDLYSDFDVVGNDLDEDLTGTSAVAEAVRSSQLARRVPSTSTTSRLASTRRSNEVVSGTRVFESDLHSGPPLTAVQRAGYSSVNSLRLTCCI